MNPEVAACYLRDQFEPSDRLAAVLLNKRAGAVIQRLASAEHMATPDFQQWLMQHNRRNYDVYVSMNALASNALGRTKHDVAAIRHIYLDFDNDGTATVDALLKRDDVPTPNALISSSPGKWQVVWKARGFGKEAAEALQKNLARATGADPAATDCARVLRLPGFYNHKYAKPHLIGVQTLTTGTYGPEQFAGMVPDDRHLSAQAARHSRRGFSGITQSERDWSYAKRALARGESPACVIAAIASYRRYDKPNPQYYAELTVRKAAQDLAFEPGRIDAPERT